MLYRFRPRPRVGAPAGSRSSRWFTRAHALTHIHARTPTHTYIHTRTRTLTRTRNTAQTHTHTQVRHLSPQPPPTPPSARFAVQYKCHGNGSRGNGTVTSHETTRNITVISLQWNCIITVMNTVIIWQRNGTGKLSTSPPVYRLHTRLTFLLHFDPLDQFDPTLLASPGRPEEASSGHNALYLLRQGRTSRWSRCHALLHTRFPSAAAPRPVEHPHPSCARTPRTHTYTQT